MKAPDFYVTGQGPNQVSLSQFFFGAEGDFIFYPGTIPQGCTVQAYGFRDAYDVLKGEGGGHQRV